MLSHTNLSKRVKILALTFAGFMAAHSLSAQEGQKGTERPWEVTRTDVLKGTRIKVPKRILKEVDVSSEDCPESLAKESLKLDAYRLKRGNRVIIAVWGRSLCYCGATGNCEFWIYSSGRHGYHKLLETWMVQEFGFLSKRRNGLPDVLLWSHDSAARSPVALWQFNGKKYINICGWDLTTERLLPNGYWSFDDTPHVENNSCVND